MTLINKILQIYKYILIDQLLNMFNIEFFNKNSNYYLDIFIYQYI